ncbi:MAG: class I SAM-dependent methyltransferase [Rhodospirillales bacterium]|nr:class I SAM-dependent methyltransferase [Rhodospirillales bacterium]
MEPAPPVIASLFPPGHFYSPVVDPATLDRAGFQTRLAQDPLAGVALDFDAMDRLFARLMRHYDAIVFPSQADGQTRYHYENDQFSYGDAIILAAMLREWRPSRYIEVGSGFSSAVVLDTNDAMGAATACTFIEPYTERLESLLRAADAGRVTVLRARVQDVPLDIFDPLQAGDILFLDTTHIVKTGSDVLHEVFHILPRLASGVIVHFHDVFAGFEYPERWVFEENRSWNEQYLLRAFLMYNSAFEILFANHWYFRKRRAEVAASAPLIARNAGGGLWLRKR